MKKKIITLCLILGFASACGTKIPKLSNGEEAVVTFKNGDKISVNELYEEMKKSATLQTLMSMVDNKILEDKFKDELDEAKEKAKYDVESIKYSYGEEEGLNAIKQYLGLQTYEAYEEYVYTSYLQNRAIEEYAKAQITDKQINNYYKSDIVGDIKVSHILITPDTTDDMKAEDKTKAENEAKKKVEDLIKELNAVEKKNVAAKFAELAKKHSEDESTKEDGGNMGFINKSTLEDGYADFGKTAYKLKDGEYTTSVVTSEDGYHIILRVESKAKASLDSVKDSVLETLSQNLIEDDATVSIEAMRQLRKEYGVEIVDTEIKTQYTNYIQNVLAQAKEQNESKEE